MERLIFGVDFSGSRKAGKYTWITAASITGDGGLVIHACKPISQLPGSGPGREVAYAALIGFIREHKDAVYGFDFPPSLPAPLVTARSWADFIVNFIDEFPDAEAFRSKCRERGQGRELRRATDRISKTPFCAYNLRMYRQTYYGITGIVCPLIASSDACFMPLQQAEEDKAWLIEICPASTLKKDGQYLIPYKEATEECRTNRARILEAYKQMTPLEFQGGEDAIISDRRGDALDSLIAAVAVYRCYSKRDLVSQDEIHLRGRPGVLLAKAAKLGDKPSLLFCVR